jgi:hypothetical protein
MNVALGLSFDHIPKRPVEAQRLAGFLINLE